MKARSPAVSPGFEAARVESAAAVTRISSSPGRVSPLASPGPTEGRLTRLERLSLVRRGTGNLFEAAATEGFSLLP